MIPLYQFPFCCHAFCFFHLKGTVTSQSIWCLVIHLTCNGSNSTCYHNRFPQFAKTLSITAPAVKKILKNYCHSELFNYWSQLDKDSSIFVRNMTCIVSRVVTNASSRNNSVKPNCEILGKNYRWKNESKKVMQLDTYKKCLLNIRGIESNCRSRLAITCIPKVKLHIYIYICIYIGKAF